MTMMYALSTFTARIGETAVLAVLPMSAVGTLHAEEEQLARSMAPDRRREFTVGRIATREALRAAGAPEVAVMMGNAGEPLWPANWVGSVSHARTHAAALVASRSHFRAVGIDVVDERSIDDDATADLMTPTEVMLVIQAGVATDVESARRFVFSAKEAVFKCQYPLTGRADLDFLEVTLKRAHGTIGVPQFVALPAFATTLIGFVIQVFPYEIQGFVLAVALALPLHVLTNV